MDISTRPIQALSGHLAEGGRMLESPFSTATRTEINCAIKLNSDTKLCSMTNVYGRFCDADNYGRLNPFVAYQWGLHC